MKHINRIVIIPIFLTLIACENPNKKTDQHETNDGKTEYFSNQLKFTFPSQGVSDTLIEDFGETLTEPLATGTEFNYPTGFTAYFDNVDAFKENLGEAPGYIIKMVKVDTVNKAVFFQPVKSAQARGLKLNVKVPNHANVTSNSYNIKSKSVIGFVLGNVGVSTDDAFNFTFKEDLYCDIPDTSLNINIVNSVWNAESSSERAKLFVIKQAYVVSYITSQYKKRNFNVQGSIPDQGGAIKIGSDVYVGSNSKQVVYKAKIIGIPLKSFTATPTSTNAAASNNTPSI